MPLLLARQTDGRTDGETDRRTPLTGASGASGADTLRVLGLVLVISLKLDRRSSKLCMSMTFEIAIEIEMVIEMKMGIGNGG